MSELREILHFVAAAVLHSWPAFLLSISLSVLVRALRLDGIIRRAFDGRVGLSILLATLVGAFSPFCSCSVVPVIAGLLLSGVPLAPVMSFWIGSPTMDPEIFALSVGVLGWRLATARLAATLVLSLAAGYITLALGRTSFLRQVLPPPKPARVEACRPPRLSRPRLSLALATTAGLTLLKPATTPLGSCAGGLGCSAPVAERPVSWRLQLLPSLREIRWPALGRDMVEESWRLGRWLLLAFLLEALITRYVPQVAIAAILGKDNVWAVPLAALIGVPMYISNIGALPVVAGLLAQGMQPGAAIAFLVAGPVTTIPAMTAVWGVTHRRVFALYLTMGLVGATLMGLAANLVLG
jgi:uncharacterized membrane protein YraQ (UPF0718 family)